MKLILILKMALLFVLLPLTCSAQKRELSHVATYIFGANDSMSKIRVLLYQVSYSHKDSNERFIYDQSQPGKLMVDGDSIFQRRRYTSEYDLIYDFSLNENDTFNVLGKYKYVVDSIDSIQLFNLTFKRQYLTELNLQENEIFIESFGSLYGGMGDYWLRYRNADSFTLLGVCIAGRLAFSMNWLGEVDTTTTCSELGAIPTLFIDKIESQSNPFNFSIYPNPSNGTFYLNYSLPEIEECSVIIFNSIGSMVYQTEWRDVKGQIVLPLNRFSRGIYYVKVIDGSNNVLYHEKAVLVE